MLKGEKQYKWFTRSWLLSLTILRISEYSKTFKKQIYTFVIYFRSFNLSSFYSLYSESAFVTLNILERFAEDIIKKNNEAAKSHNLEEIIGPKGNFQLTQLINFFCKQSRNFYFWLISELQFGINDQIMMLACLAHVLWVGVFMACRDTLRIKNQMWIATTKTWKIKEGNVYQTNTK
jgi:hypothetical protein